MTVGPRKAEGDGLHMDFVPVMCFHCDEPACATLCPVGAISKGEDGIVLVDQHMCTGCEICVHGCPYGVMAYNEQMAVPVIATAARIAAREVSNPPACNIA